MKVVNGRPIPEPGKQITGGVERVIDNLVHEISRQVDLTLITRARRGTPSQPLTAFASCT